jgi:creatinine amidohydrolase
MSATVNSDVSSVVRWEELLPREFLQRLDELPLVYLPLGLCEPHGHVAAFGLDTLKAVYLCEEAARRFGGIVAPTQGYQIHETGYHRPWLDAVLGDVNPRLGSIPPDVLLRLLVFQLRAFVNAGFRAVLVVTGHNGNQADLRIVAEEFARARSVQVVAVSDPELVAGEIEGDHAGKYEVSQLLHIRPDLVRLDRIDDPATSPLRGFGQGEDAGQATASFGQAILEKSVGTLETIVEGLSPISSDPELPFITIEDAEQIWRRVHARIDEWCTMREEDPPLDRP